MAGACTGSACAVPRRCRGDTGEGGLQRNGGEGGLWDRDLLACALRGVGPVLVDDITHRWL